MDTTGIVFGPPVETRSSIKAEEGGSFALVGAKYRAPATIVKRLEEAGAIILGKANLSQRGNSRSEHCSNGWSALYGQALAGFHDNQDPQVLRRGTQIATSLNLAAGNIGGEVRILLSPPFFV